MGWKRGWAGPHVLAKDRPPRPAPRPASRPAPRPAPRPGHRSPLTATRPRPTTLQKLFPTTKEVDGDIPCSLVQAPASPGLRAPRPLVVKVGGSLLRSRQDYAAMAKALVPVLESGPAWIVVSAAKGMTDALERLARRELDGPQVLALQQAFGPDAVPDTLRVAFHGALDQAAQGRPGALLAWGEQASARLLATDLAALGHHLDIVDLQPDAHVPPFRNAIVPGFYTRDAVGQIHILPRGGSDISAVLAARWLSAPEVRLWKEGGGIRIQPGLAVPAIDAHTLVAWLGDRVRPIHPEAVRLAAALDIPLTLEDPTGEGGATRISAAATAEPIPSLPVTQAVAGEAAP